MQWCIFFLHHSNGFFSLLWQPCTFLGNLRPRGCIWPSWPLYQALKTLPRPLPTQAFLCSLLKCFCPAEMCLWTWIMPCSCLGGEWRVCVFMSVCGNLWHAPKMLPTLMKSRVMSTSPPTFDSGLTHHLACGLQKVPHEGMWLFSWYSFLTLVLHHGTLLYKRFPCNQVTKENSRCSTCPNFPGTALECPIFP